ncbi:MAG TPA: glycolate oxidase subunit GlcF [Alphaproteobacteria bacterium]|nr:glycolate oxidase subunit GlcF [Alphaproteobacteria bacterium]
MQTHFTLAQLADPRFKEADKILRACVHCGFCTATCPTYVLLGDELDSPRGRVYLIKDMLEGGKAATTKIAKHIDRCLSCLSCMTTCPSAVHYMHLVDHARVHIEETYRRPFLDRLLRAFLARVLPYPGRMRAALLAAALAKPLMPLTSGRLRALLSLAPGALPTPSAVDRPQAFPAEGARRMRVALLAGCAQQVLVPSINEATVRLLTRHGCEVVVAQGARCCGALVHHLGNEGQALQDVRANTDAWSREIEGAGLDAIVVNASGCGTMVKDYGFLLRNDPQWSARGSRVAGLARDVSEVMASLGLKAPARPTGLAVAYHSACALQHGQRVNAPPRALLSAAGFELREIPEGHLCCGSAGTYNMLQPALADAILERKAGNIQSTGAAIVATGNIGCIAQLRRAVGVPVVHTVELLDWATGGPLPPAVAARDQPRTSTAS